MHLGCCLLTKCLVLIKVGCPCCGMSRAEDSRQPFQAVVCLKQLGIKHIGSVVPSLFNAFWIVCQLLT